MLSVPWGEIEVLDGIGEGSSGTRQSDVLVHQVNRGNESSTSTRHGGQAGPGLDSAALATGDGQHAVGGSSRVVAGVDLHLATVLGQPLHGGGSVGACPVGGEGHIADPRMFATAVVDVAASAVGQAVAGERHGGHAELALSGLGLGGSALLLLEVFDSLVEGRSGADELFHLPVFGRQEASVALCGHAHDEIHPGLHVGALLLEVCE